MTRSSTGGAHRPVDEWDVMTAENARKRAPMLSLHGIRGGDRLSVLAVTTATRQSPLAAQAMNILGTGWIRAMTGTL